MSSLIRNDLPFLFCIHHMVHAVAALRQLDLYHPHLYSCLLHPVSIISALVSFLVPYSPLYYQHLSQCQHTGICGSDKFFTLTFFALEGTLLGEGIGVSQTGTYGTAQLGMGCPSIQKRSDYPVPLVTLTGHLTIQLPLLL